MSSETSSDQQRSFVRHPALLLVLPPLFWSGNFVVASGVHELFGPVALNFWRWTIALAVLIAWHGKTAWRQRRAVLRHLPLLVVFGAVSVASFNSFLYKAFETTPVVNAAVINSAIPLLIPLFAMLLAGERATRRQWIGIALSLCGVLWLLARGEPRSLFGLEFGAGDGWVMLAVLSWAIYSVMLRWRPRELDPATFLLSIAATGTLVLAFLLPFETQLAPVGGWTWRMLAVILYLGIFPSVLAYTFWNRAIAELGATRTGLGVHLMPVFAGVLAWLFLAQPIRPYHGIGALLIAIGIVVTARRPR